MARRFRAFGRLGSLVLAAVLVAASAAFAEEKAPAEKPPESNKGRKGTYQAKTSHPGYNYYVYVPASYSDENPAGIHVFFHGQGGGGGAQWFGNWSKYFCDPYNLVGINMQYEDGDNAKDTAGKVAAAAEAIKQVMADYKIVLGRGAVGSFSGGGLPHERIFGQFGTTRPGGPPACPFNHSAIYDSNYRDNVSNLSPMSWFVGLGSEEWDMAALGATQTGRAAELFAAAAKGGCPDVYLKITKGKGHSIADEDVRDSAMLFRRSDLAFAPFLYEKDYPEAALQPIVKQASILALGRAGAAADKVIADAKADEKTKAKAEAIKKKVDARIDAILALAKGLDETDAALLNFYAAIWVQQLAGHAKAKDLKDLVAEAKKKPTFKPALATYGQFCGSFKGFFQDKKVSPSAVKFLEDAKAKCGDKSLVGLMATEFLMLQ